MVELTEVESGKKKNRPELAAFAEHEREMISQRTEEGLRAAKARGAVLSANSAAVKARYTAEVGRRA